MNKWVLLITIPLLFFTGCGANEVANDVQVPDDSTVTIIVETDTLDSLESDVVSDDMVETATSEESIFDEEAYISQLSSAINLAIAPRDDINEVSIENGVLFVSVTLVNNNVTLERFSSISDRILSIEDGYSYWDSIVIDFGSLGYIEKDKQDIVYEEDGNHFEITQDDIIHIEE